jgi:hypothetical protein
MYFPTAPESRIGFHQKKKHWKNYINLHKYKISFTDQLHIISKGCGGQQSAHFHDVHKKATARLKCKTMQYKSSRGWLYNI